MQNDPESQRVSDAPSGNWVYRVLPISFWPYAQLARWDRPIGWQLLMWPCFWSATLAAHAGNGSLSRLLYHLFLFAVGAIAMRGAGCTYNDLVDQEIDAKVARTRSRPLPAGRISRREAKIFLACQALAGLLVLVQFNVFTIIFGFLSLGLVALYPFAKRFTDWPQLFLGLAFSWGGLMGWAAQFGALSWAPILLYAGCVSWTIGYDTIYAHQDREDDSLIGIGSTARLFGPDTRVWLSVFYGLTSVLLIAAFWLAGIGLLAWVGLCVATLMLGWQVLVLDIKDSAACLRLFKFNSLVGAVIFATLFLSLGF